VAFVFSHNSRKKIPLLVYKFIPLKLSKKDKGSLKEWNEVVGHSCPTYGAVDGTPSPPKMALDKERGWNSLPASFDDTSVIYV
jgi:hypothetical protein